MVTFEELATAAIRFSDPSLTAEQRNAIAMTISQASSDLSNLSCLSFSLIQNCTDPQQIHLGFKLLSEKITQFRNSSDATLFAFLNSLRDPVLGLLCSVSQDTSQVVVMLLSSFTVQLALTIEWPELYVALTSFKDSGEKAKLELLFTIRSAFMRELGDDTVKGGQQQRLRQAALARDGIQDAIDICNRQISDISVLQKLIDSTRIALLHCGADLISVYTPHICRLLLLPVPGIRKQALRHLFVVLRNATLLRDYSKVSTDIAEFITLPEVRQQLFAGTGDFVQDYQFLQSLAEFMGSVTLSITLQVSQGGKGTQQNGAAPVDALRQRREAVSELLSRIADVVIDLMAHPSPRIFFDTLNFWSMLLRNEQTARAPALANQWLRLLQILPFRAQKSGDPTSLAPGETNPAVDPRAVDPAVPFSRLEFIDKEQWRQWLSKSRQFLREIVQQLVAFMPAQTLIAAGRAVQSMMSTVSDEDAVIVGGPAHATADGSATTHSPTFVALEGVLFFADCAVSGLFTASIGVCGVPLRRGQACPEWLAASITGPTPLRPPVHATKDPYSPEVVQLHVQLLQLIMQIRPKRHAIIGHRALSSLINFSGFLTRYADQFPQLAHSALARLLEALTFRSVTETGRALSDLSVDTLAYRRKGATVLMAMATQCPTIIQPHLSSLWQFVSDLAARAAITESEYFTVLVALAVVVHICTPTQPEREAVLGQLLAPMIQPIVQLGSSVRGADDILGFLQPQSDAQADWARRRGLAHGFLQLASFVDTAALLPSVCQGSSVAAMWPVLVPPVTALVRVLAAVFCDAPPQWGEYLALPEAERRRLMGVVAAGQLGVPGEQPQTMSEYVRHWLLVVHQSGCHLLAGAARDNCLPLQTVYELFNERHVQTDPLFRLRITTQSLLRVAVRMMPTRVDLCRLLLELLRRSYTEQCRKSADCMLAAGPDKQDQLDQEVLHSKLLSEYQVSIAQAVSSIANVDPAIATHAATFLLASSPRSTINVLAQVMRKLLSQQLDSGLGVDCLCDIMFCHMLGGCFTTNRPMELSVSAATALRKAYALNQQYTIAFLRGSFALDEAATTDFLHQVLDVKKDIQLPGIMERLSAACGFGANTAESPQLAALRSATEERAIRRLVEMLSL